MKTKRSLIILFSFVFLLSIFVAACGKDTTAPSDPQGPTNEPVKEEVKNEEPKDEGPKYGGDLIVGTIGNPVMFNPLYYNDTASGDIAGNVMNGMLSANEKFEPIPYLAKSWEFSDDGLTWTFYLRDDVKWHDGQPFTAEDVKFTFEVPLHPDYSGPRASSFESIETVEVVDPYTVRFNLKEADASFIWVAGYGIIPKHILGDVPVADLGEHEYNFKPIGTGPFKFEEWKEGEYVKIVAYEDYYLGRPYLDSITYKIVPDQNALLAQLEAGDIHYMTVPATEIEIAEELQKAGKTKLDETLGLSYTYIGWNQKHEMFQDKRVRQALTHAIDRQLIVDSVLNGKGEVAHAPESPLSWAYNPNTKQFNYDVEKAKALLAEAGWTPGADGILEKDGKKFSFKIKTNQGNKAREQIAVIVQQMLKEVGIDAQPELVEWSALLAQIDPPARDFEGLVLGWSLGVDPDPTDIWHSKERELGLNMINYSNPEIDPLMDENKKLLDRGERQKLIWKIFDTIVEDQPYTFMYYPLQTKAMPTYMEGFIHHPRNPFYKANEWWFNQ